MKLICKGDREILMDASGYSSQETSGVSRKTRELASGLEPGSKRADTQDVDELETSLIAMLTLSLLHHQLMWL